MTSYNRANPSARYRQLMALYARMHAEGETRLGLSPEQTFPGKSLLPHIGRIKHLIEATRSRTVLDYGSGKGLQYRPQRIVVGGKHVADSIAEYWDVDEVRCYDPGFAPHATLPRETFDAVISTDVLEHCPVDDLPWIIDEIFSCAAKFVYLNVACFPARKSLPNGENAHATVRAPGWWRTLVAERAAPHPAIVWELHAAQESASGVRETAFRSGELATLPSAGEKAISTVSIEGREAQFWTPNDMTRWRAQTLYTKEPVTIDWLRAMTPGATLLDVGANVGMYTVFAALARRANVFAFEPESQNYAVLNENIRINDLGDQVLAVCAGLSDRPGIERLFLSAAVPGGSCHSLGAEVGFDLAPRPAAFAQGAIALCPDELVQEGQLPVPDYIKIDVDGFEHKVLKGLNATLRDARVRSLIVELNPKLEPHREIREQLRSLGFHWDPGQVEAAARTSGPFEGVAEHVFQR